MPALTLGLQIAGFCVGLLFIYGGLFLYEDEAGRIQSRLEDLWIKIDDQSKAKLAKHKLFIREVTQFTYRTIEKFLRDKEADNGTEVKTTSQRSRKKVPKQNKKQSDSAPVFKPFSPWRMNRVVTHLWVFSIGVLLIFVRDFDYFRFAYFTEPACRLLLYTYAFFALALLLPTPIQIMLILLFRREKVRRIVHYSIATLNFVLIVFGPYIIEKELNGNQALSFTLQLKTLLSIYIGGMISIFGYWMFVFNLRLMVLDTQDPKRFSTTEVLLQSFMMVALFVPPTVGLLFVSLMAAPGDTGFLDGNFWSGVLFIVGAANIYLAFLSTAFLFLSASMVVHRILWPLTSRPVYALQRLGVAKRHKLMSLIGVGLVVTSLGVDTTWLKKLLVDLINAQF